jgi:deoxyribodipyrimidine photo-lyase
MTKDISLAGKKTIIVWFRRDLRVQDNPALNAALEQALEQGYAVLPVYIHAPQEEGDWSPGGAAGWWQHHALASLQKALEALGLSLLIRRGDSQPELMSIATEANAVAVHWNRRYEPVIIKRDSGIKKALQDAGLEAKSHNAALLWEPPSIKNGSGLPYRVFTPFWKYCLTQPTTVPYRLPNERQVGETNRAQPLAGLSLSELKLTPTLGWADGFKDHWNPTLTGAEEALQLFARDTVRGYGKRRDIPGVQGTSRLSPFLQSGQLGPRQIWAAIHQSGAANENDGHKFLSEIAWREFAYHLLYHFPETPHEALNRAYRNFPWEPQTEHLKAWQKGLTGYPIVDAGMRELWHTGWMHNRVRMIVGSFLVKHLLQPWQSGARWFWDTLVDADLASNTMGWQWIAGCGADAAPYFRIFNPMLQGAKFDADGSYVRTWIPEIAKLPDSVIHTPWEASSAQLASAGITLGKTYPRPVVDHQFGRERALGALKVNKEIAATIAAAGD